MADGPPGSSSTEAGSSHARKKSQVLAIAEARTSSLLVSAATSMMPEIAKLIAQLDDSPGRREVVRVFELQKTRTSKHQSDSEGFIQSERRRAE